MAESSSLVLLATATANQVIVWNSQTLEQVSSYQDDNDQPFADVAWNHNGEVLACARRHGPTSLMGSKTSTLLESIPSGAQTVSFGSKSRYLCLAGDHAVVVRDLKKKTIVRQFDVDQVTSAGLDATCTYVVALCPAGLSIFQLRESQLVREIDVTELDCVATCWDLDANLAAVGTDQGQVLVRNVMDTQVSATIRHSDSAVVDVAWIDAGHQLAVLSATLFAIYDWRTGTTVTSKALQQQTATCMALHPQNPTVALGFASGTVLLWDWQAVQAVGKLGLSGPPQCLAFAPAPGKDVPSTVAPSLATARQQPDDVIRALIRDEVGRLGEDVRTDLVNLHVDMLRQFQRQSEEVAMMLAQRGDDVNELARDNLRLRKENAALRDELARAKEERR